MDSKGLGYFISIVSVLLLGAAAWPKADAPDWVQPALIAGMTASIIGMGLRFLAHLKEKRELEEAKRNESLPG